MGNCYNRNKNDVLTINYYVQCIGSIVLILDFFFY